MDEKDDKKQPEQDVGLRGTIFEDIRLWLTLLLLPAVLFVAYSIIGALGKNPEAAPQQQSQPQQAQIPPHLVPVPSARGGGEMQDYNFVTPEKAEACDFSQWVGKPLNLIALQKLERPHTFYMKGTELEPTGDPRAINIELDGAMVTKVWCG